jgi:outer membrane protein assembly factor BamA
MKTLWVTALVLAAPLAGCSVPDDDEKISQELNVNSRYMVESVHVSGQRSVTISDPLRTELDQVVGHNLDRSALDQLADRIKKELHVNEVAIKVTRGLEPNHVVVDFEVTKSHQQDFDLKVAKFLYNSAEGWSGDGSAATTFKGNTFTVGILSDGDSLIERVAGIRAKFERKRLGTERLSLKFEFDSYHDQWNRATLLEASPADIYQSRQVFTPEATVVIIQPLEWSFGVSFARLRVPDPVQTEGGGAAAAKTESSNAVVNTLRYHQRWGSARDEQQQEVTGVYTVSSATGVLGTDRDFTRHMAQAHYKYRHARQHVDVGFLAGRLNGNAPLYERFVLGDSTTLRGWSKFDLDPLGGSRVMHGSVDYQYRFLQAFYDAGAIWDRPQDRDQKQSAGVGFKKEYFQLAVAFPLRSGRVDPIFYAGMNF